MLLENRLCSVKVRKVWRSVGLIPSQFDDSLTCFHGDRSFRNCFSSKLRGVYLWKGCRWWHFTSDNTRDSIREKFEFVRGFSGPMNLSQRDLIRNNMKMYHPRPQ